MQMAKGFLLQQPSHISVLRNAIRTQRLDLKEKEGDWTKKGCAETPETPFRKRLLAGGLLRHLTQHTDLSKCSED